MKCIPLHQERAKYLYSRNPMLSICAFGQFSVDKNDHQIVNASRRCMQVICLRLSCHVDTHVSLNIPYIFWKAKHLQIQQIANKVTLALHSVVGPKKRKVTAHSLCDKNLQEEICHLDEGYAIFCTIQNTPPYFEAKKKEVLSMVCQLGIPTIFFSMSSADTSWVPLLKCIGLLVDKEVYSDECITNEMSFDNKCQLVAAYPAVCSTYFNNHVARYIKLILMSPHSPFGQLVDYVYRAEFQKRGSPHIHGLFWICNAPQYGKNTKAEICPYIDKCIPCTLDVSESEKPYVKLQIHKHSKTYKKIVRIMTC